MAQLTKDRVISQRDAEKLIRTTKIEADKAIASSRDLRFVTDHFLIAIAYNTGLRISELSALNWGDILEDCLIVRRGKGGKARSVFFGAATQAMVEKFRGYK